MTDLTACTISTVWLYSTGHWIGGTVMLGFVFNTLWQEVTDPTGLKARFRMLRS